MEKPGRGSLTAEAVLDQVKTKKLLCVCETAAFFLSILLLASGGFGQK